MRDFFATDSLYFLIPGELKNEIAMIKRLIEDKIQEKLFKKKAIIIVGARQIGKTTSINNVLEKKENVLFLAGDDPVVRSILENANT